MSEILFPRANDRPALRRRLALLATVAGVLFALFSAWLGLSFVGAVGGDVTVTARVVSLGDSLGVNSNVKFRGLKIGRVTHVDTARDADGLYHVHLTVSGDQADQVPAGVRARVLPTTIFGAEYVDLVDPDAGADASEIQAVAATTGGTGLEDGDIIRPDDSPETARLMDAVTTTQQILGAIDPASMDEALHQLAAAIDGKGEDLGRFLERSDVLAGQIQGAQPTLVEDLKLLNENLATGTEIEPQLAETLSNSLPVATTIANRAEKIDALLSSGTRLVDHVGTFLTDHGAELARFLNAVAPTYTAFVGGIKPFTAILRGAAPVLHNGATAISNHAIQMWADFAFDRPKNYTYRDCPSYGAVKGSNCR